MNNDTRRLVTKARQRLHDLYLAARHLGVIEQARAEASPAERKAVEAYGWDRLFGEVERQRKGPGRLRRGDRTVSKTGEQLSLSLLGMTVAQARANNENKLSHARGSVAEAEFERMVIDIAEERMRERGLDPYVTDLVIGEFVDSDEIAVLRRRRAA